MSHSNSASIALDGIIAVRATSAASFDASVGVNAHIDSGAVVWENTTLLLQEMAYLGASNIRDGTPYASYLSVYVALAQAGIKFDLEQSNATQGPFTTVSALADTDRADTLVAAVPGSVESMEGANEYNINSYNLNGITSEADGISWGVLDDQNLRAAVQADANLVGVPVVAASVEDVTVPAFGIAPYIDVANAHVYFGVGDQLQTNETTELGWAQASAPGKPIWVTEAGISSSGYGTSFWGVTDQATQGVIDTNVLLDGWYNGVGKTFFYDLMDDGTVSTDQDDNFGLFNQNGTPKPVATDIHNLTTILADPNGRSFSPGTLDYTISGMPSTALSMLLEKADGSYWLVIWNAIATLYNGSANVTPTTSNVNVTLGSANYDTNVYNPIQGATAVSSLSRITSVALALSADPLIVEISAIPTISLSAPGTAQEASVGSGVTITETVTTTNLFGNVYEEVLTANGTVESSYVPVALTMGVGSSSVHLAKTGDTIRVVDNPTAQTVAATSSSVTITDPVVPPPLIITGSGPDTLALLVSEDAWNGNAQFTLSVDGKQIGGTETATALHSMDQMQTFDVLGLFPAGNHIATVDFLNDAYGGTPTTDRNLYVTGASIDDAVVPGAALTEYSQGPRASISWLPAPTRRPRRPRRVMDLTRWRCWFPRTPGTVTLSLLSRSMASRSAAPKQPPRSIQWGRRRNVSTTLIHPGSEFKLC